MSRLGPSPSGAKHAVIAAKLLKLLESGTYRPGDFLPPERSLSEQFSVSRPTLRKALSTLIEQGKLVNHPGLGTRVAARGRSLKDSQSWQVIGLLVPDFENQFFVEVTEAIEHTALQRGYQVLLCNSRHQPGIEEMHLRQLTAQRVDGAILVHDPYTAFPDAVSMLKKAGVSYVALFSSPSVADCDSVVLDDYAGVTEAMRYLFSLGHRSIAFCRAVEGEHIHPREQAYRQCMEQSGLPILPHFLVPNISDAREAGLQVMEKVFQTEPVPTAIFAGNDQTALLCVKFLNALGKRIPRDISVVGFDNLRFTEHLSVPLTTVDQPKREMGRRAVEMLLERLELGIAPEPRVERFRPHLVIRDSCGISPLPENSLSDRTAELASL